MEKIVQEFITKSGADQVITDLQAYLKDHPLDVSDVHDEQGHQYVDLVQEGGGVWGIALVGYTYALEKAGIRFFSLAGTSAGSINAMLLACTGNKEDTKSEKIIQHFLELELFKIVDGKSTNWNFTKLVKRLIQRAIVEQYFISNLVGFFHWTLLFLLCFCLTSFAANFFYDDARWIGLGAAILIVALITFGVYVFFRFKDFTRNGYGLNEGVFFHNWIKKRISENDIESNPALGKINDLEDFEKHFKRVPPGLRVRPDASRVVASPPANPMLSIITCDVVTGRKIEFPRMWDLYWAKMKDIHPGDFVRASMSIPLFFQTFTLSGVNKKSNLEIWQQELDWKGVVLPGKAQLVDGGTLSNFPISVFSNPAYPVPRMPTWGIRLMSSLPDVVSYRKSSLVSYANAIIGAMRANYDRDFISKNRAFDLGVKAVYLKGHNWLNFFMTTEEKCEIFRKGVEAGAEFLREFNWEDYKKARLANWKKQHAPEQNPNNFY
ncbi:patatin-like phospholipase family protein [Chitinophaga nivalis]|uniref:Patatin-like phospholipase family protein n=1 Tax=Chitinophaga nivalis TaxID=2991709 RepID=A0ABT3IHG6_9BACT|nr:patatin-like phospholipase family protein [Chitinophaga nivalis]MCW3467105.1 patatin-like phospholipase family protein [Chitinophaga nivalis]MCW3483204.1 patatin-like phospholipase family protein [Chitinophaga nivalis]